MNAHTDIKLDDNVPVPSIKGRGRTTIYPFAEMLPNQSFFVVKEKGPTVRACIHKHRSPDKSFTSRAVIEDGVEGIRVWRIK